MSFVYTVAFFFSLHIDGNAKVNFWQKLNKEQRAEFESFKNLKYLNYDFAHWSAHMFPLPLQSMAEECKDFKMNIFTCFLPRNLED